MSEFVNLHVHSSLSVSIGASSIDDILEKVKSENQSAVAITDTNNAYGILDFSLKAIKYGIKPICGVELYTDFGGSILVLAKDQIGYRTLLMLISSAYQEGVIPVTTMENLEQYNEGIIVLTGSQTGFLFQQFEKENEAAGIETLEHLHKIFGNNLYVEISRTGKITTNQAEIENKIIELAEDRYPLVATTDIWYATKDKHDSFEILKAIREKSTLHVNDNGLIPTMETRYHIRTNEEMADLFKDIPVALQNAVEISKRCSIKAETRNPILPGFGTNEEEDLKQQSIIGLQKRLAGKDKNEKEYFDRLEYELSIINQMGFPGYFLIVADFVRYALDANIPVGPGRGSGAGSIVAWALEITDLDPISYGLLFERFLNPERISMPDFDIDFCENRRGEVIKYVQKKYGYENVSKITTLREIKSKTALKDVARILIHDEFGSYPYGFMNEMTKMVPQNGAEPDSLEESIKDSQFKALLDESPKNMALYDAALKVEGLYKNIGSHAAGIIIGDNQLKTLAPFGKDMTEDIQTCQFPMKQAELSGLVKFDFLGLKTLTVIKRAVDLINERAENPLLEIENIPMDSKETYEMLSVGLTAGVFQLESPGMIRVLKDIKPTKIQDLIAIVALYRPGPMDQIPHYAKCKNNITEVIYPNPEEKTKPILEETFGIMVYQEQVIQVAQAVAGYSLGGADILRRAMGKKDPVEMASQKNVFVTGSMENGTEKRDAEALFSHIDKFAGYGFNKSHAAAYALLSYRTAWLKSQYPIEFYAALLSFETENPERMAMIKKEMDLMGVKLLTPCVQKSEALFSVEGKAVRFGLTALKNIVGDLKEVLNERQKGEFIDIFDFHKRCFGYFNKAQIQKLAESGSFDSLTQNRNRASSSLTWLLTKDVGAKNKNQMNLFGGANEITIPDKIRKLHEWDNVVDREFVSAGFYFNQHPVDAHIGRLAELGIKRKKSIINYMDMKNLYDIHKAKLCVMIDKFWVATSRNNREYIRAEVFDKDERYMIMFFGSEESIEQQKDLLEKAKINRQPIIIIANLVRQDSDPKNISIWGKEVWEINRFFEEHNMGENIVVRLDIEDSKEKPKDVIKEKIEQITKKIEEYRDMAKGGTILIKTEEGNYSIEGSFMFDEKNIEELKYLKGVSSIKRED